jgi:hypothetical protein
LGAHAAAVLTGLQVVAFQAMMELMGSNFPGVFQGYTLDVSGSGAAVAPSEQLWRALAVAARPGTQACASFCSL